MSKTYLKFKKGVTVNVAECYLNDEVTENHNTSPTAIVFAEPSDAEELIGIQYDSGELDYVPQDILEIDDESIQKEAKSYIIIHIGKRNRIKSFLESRPDLDESDKTKLNKKIEEHEFLISEFKKFVK